VDKSPFIYKTSREQFCINYHKRLVILKDVEEDKARHFLKNVSSKGVAMRLTLRQDKPKTAKKENTM
jgi:ribosomal protein S10